MVESGWTIWWTKYILSYFYRYCDCNMIHYYWKWSLFAFFWGMHQTKQFSYVWRTKCLTSLQNYSTGIFLSSTASSTALHVLYCSLHTGSVRLLYILLSIFICRCHKLKFIAYRNCNRWCSGKSTKSMDGQISSGRQHAVNIMWRLTAASKRPKNMDSASN